MHGRDILKGISIVVATGDSIFMNATTSTTATNDNNDDGDDDENDDDNDERMKLPHDKNHL